jgi:hypothetical protein
MNIAKSRKTEYREDFIIKIQSLPAHDARFVPGPHITFSSLILRQLFLSLQANNPAQDAKGVSQFLWRPGAAERFQASLRDLRFSYRRVPRLESLGYFRMSLRDMRKNEMGPMPTEHFFFEKPRRSRQSQNPSGFKFVSPPTLRWIARAHRDGAGTRRRGRLRYVKGRSRPVFTK